MGVLRTLEIQKQFKYPVLILTAGVMVAPYLLLLVYGLAGNGWVIGAYLGFILMFGIFGFPLIEYYLAKGVEEWEESMEESKDGC